MLILLVLLASACGTDTVEPQIPTPVPPTATLPEPTDTPLPTPTDTPAPTETPIPTSTPDFAATAAVEATQIVQAKIEEIDEELQKVNQSAEQGHFGWSSDSPEEIFLDSYGEAMFVPFAERTQYSNFVLHVNIKWESTLGFAGCGVFFRSEESLEDGAQYQFLTMRLSGAPAWDVEYWKYNEWQATLTGNVKFNNVIDYDDGHTNEYVLIAEDALLTVYANDVRLGSVSISTLSKGRFAFAAFQDAGETTCTFSDVWVWDLTDS
jgi:hypothetical protein